MHTNYSANCSARTFARGGVKNVLKNGSFLHTFAQNVRTFVYFVQLLFIFVQLFTATCANGSKTCAFVRAFSVLSCITNCPFSPSLDLKLEYCLQPFAFYFYLFTSASADCQIGVSSLFLMPKPALFAANTTAPCLYICNFALHNYRKHK